jgi:hypothetical protein
MLFNNGNPVRFQLENYTSNSRRMLEFVLKHVGYDHLGFMEFQGNIGPIGFLNSNLYLSDDNNKKYEIFHVDYDKRSIWLSRKD